MSDDRSASTEGRKSAGKSAAAFRTISEVSDDLDIPQHVLRFWESRFTQVRPLKRGGGRRYYRPDDIRLLGRIRQLLYDEGYTIRGVQKLLKDNGIRAVIEGEIVPVIPGANGEAVPAVPLRAAASHADGEAVGGAEDWALKRPQLQAALDELLAIRALLDTPRG